MENLSGIVEQVTVTSKALAEFAKKLDDEKITPKLYRDFETLTDDFVAFSDFIKEMEEELSDLQKTAEETRLKAVAEIIAHLERRELDYYLKYKPNIYKPLVKFDGYLFLEAYLGEITKNNKHPLDTAQLYNYVWELIAIDIAKRTQGRENLLDLWTNAPSYSRYMMVEEQEA